MKKILLLFASLFLIVLSLSSQVERELVVVEIGTGTWCVFCPGAASAADDMVANGLDVAIIENHNGDSFANAGSNARNAYYAISGYPTGRFDGLIPHVGGDDCPPPFSVYSTYQSKYNQRKAVQSPFTMELEFSSTGPNEYQASVHMVKVASVPTDDLKLHVVVTESHIATTWFCMSECNFVNRLMVPGQNGTSLDFSGGDEVTVNLNFSVSSSWNLEHMELVAFIQDQSSKEIHQATKKSMAVPEHDLDAELISVSNIPEGNCSGILQPEVTIKNKGAENLTSLTINCQANNDEVFSHEWTGTLEFLETETIVLDPITFTPAGETNMLTIYSTDPNGDPDQNTLNDTLTSEFGEAFLSEYYKIAFLLRTDANPEELTYVLKDAQGQVFYTGGPFEEPSHIYRDTFELFTSNCYQFIMSDAGCNGLEGTSFYTLREAKSGGQTIVSGGDFACNETTEFQISWVGLEDDMAEEPSLSVYPNPFDRQTSFYLTTNHSEEVSVMVYDLLGKSIFEKNHGILPPGEHVITLSRNNMADGIHFYQVKIGQKVLTGKLILENQ